MVGSSECKFTQLVPGQLLFFQDCGQKKPAIVAKVESDSVMYLKAPMVFKSSNGDPRSG